MENSDNVLKKYLYSVEKLSLLWDNLAKKASKPLGAIESLADQLQAASSVGHDDVISNKFPELKEQIICRTLRFLEQEILLIMFIVEDVGIATEKMNKLASMIESHSETKNFASATVSASMVLEVVSDCRQYYQSQYLGLQIALKCLDYRDLESIKDLRKSLFGQRDLKKHVQCCYIIGKHYLSELEDCITSS